MKRGACKLEKDGGVVRVHPSPQPVRLRDERISCPMDLNLPAELVELADSLRSPRVRAEMSWLRDRPDVKESLAHIQPRTLSEEGDGAHREKAEEEKEDDVRRRGAKKGASKRARRGGAAAATTTCHAPAATAGGAAGGAAWVADETSDSAASTPEVSDGDYSRCQRRPVPSLPPAVAGSACRPWAGLLGKRLMLPPSM